MPSARWTAAAVGAVLFTALWIWPRGDATFVQEGPAVPMRLAVYAGDTSMLVYVARERGDFRRHGLDLELVELPSGKQCADELIAGTVDACTSADFVFSNHVLERPDLRIFGTVARFRSLRIVVRADLGITSAKDLAGRKLGVTGKSSGEFHLVQFLAMHGMQVGDVARVDLTPPELVKAMTSGALDAVSSWDPNVYEIERRMGERVHPLDVADPMMYEFVLVATEAWLEQHPEAARRFLAALLDAEAHVREHRDELPAFFQSQFGYTPEFSAHALEVNVPSVQLSQGLVMGLEQQARWLRKHRANSSSATSGNCLDYIHVDALESVKPQSVTIIR